MRMLASENHRAAELQRSVTSLFATILAKTKKITRIDSQDVHTCIHNILNTQGQGYSNDWLMISQSKIGIGYNEELEFKFEFEHTVSSYCVEVGPETWHTIQSRSSLTH